MGDEIRPPLDLRGWIGRFAWLMGLVAGLLLYALGVGIAQHLGGRVRLDVYLVGQGFVLSLGMFTYFSHRYFDVREVAKRMGERVFGFFPWRNAMLTGLLVAATIAAGLALVLIQLGMVSGAAAGLMLVAVLGVCSYTLPPLRIAETGFGELLEAVLLAAVVPALGLTLTYGDFHRFLPMVAFPLGAIYLAMSIALSLPRYAQQQKYEMATLLTRLGWQNGMTAHNLLILSAFLLIAVAALFNFPNFAVFPSLLLFPLGLLEIYYMTRIAGGLKPNWNALTVSSTAMFGLMIYLLALAFWTH